MRILIDKNIVRRWFEAVIRTNLDQPLTAEQELVIALLAAARSQGVGICVTLETYNILTRILSNSVIAKAIIANTDVLYRSKPFKQWLIAVKRLTNLTAEDAKILAYATFGTNISGTAMGCDRLITLDAGLVNEFQAKKPRLKSKLKSLKSRLAPQYQQAYLPNVVLVETEGL